MISKDALVNVLNDILLSEHKAPGMETYILHAYRNGMRLIDGYTGANICSFQFSDGCLQNVSVLSSHDFSALAEKMKKIMNADDIAELNRMTE